MTEEKIADLIEQLNSATYHDFFTIIPLSTSVDLAKVWLNAPHEDYAQGDGTPDIFYFIKNYDHYYVGAVKLMKEGYLHWYILPEHRKKGYLSTALSKSVLPHLHRHTVVIRVNIDIDYFDSDNMFEDSKSVALRVGFEKFSGEEYVFIKKNLEY